MKKFCLHKAIAIVFLMLNVGLWAQTEGVSIRNSPAAPDQSAMLDVYSTNKGLLMPRCNLLTNIDVSSVPSPANSLIIYNNSPSTSNGLQGRGYYYWDAFATPAQWKKMNTGPELWQKISTSNNIYYNGGKVVVGPAAVTPTYNMEVQEINGGTYSVKFDATLGAHLRFGFQDLNGEVGGGNGTWLTVKTASMICPSSATWLCPGSPYAWGNRWSLLYGNKNSAGGWEQGLVFDAWAKCQNVIGWSTVSAYSNNLTIQTSHTLECSSTNGLVRLTAQGFQPISDSTLKRDITSHTSVLTNIADIRPVTYRMKTDPDGPIQHGFLAQEVESIFPELIENINMPATSTTDEQLGPQFVPGATKKGLNYTGFIAILLKAVQEQQALIVDLQNRVTALENK